ncbi:MAG: fructose-1,6-bisphosphatase [Proteobacteria bacterium]|nr:fructose-1,6-bisphosphatase [Pseudomonadota bacterium]MBU1056926.1 fructose-1,6-bisphosphatase [Pseudomonadota bacterium]
MKENGFRLHTSELDKLAQQLLEIENELNSNIPVTLWISDLHGEGDRFMAILRGRFGMLYQTCREALPTTFSVDKIQYLTQIIRKKKYIEEEHILMDTQDVIFCLVQILKYRLSNIRHRTKNIFPPEFRNTIKRLISGLPVPDQVFEEKVLSERLISHLAHSIREILLDRILVLGDIFDRGAQPDKIIRILSSFAYRDMVDYVFGNHDILWMGAVSGNQSLVAEAMRITCRYDHFELMERLHFDSSKLAAFAEKNYPVEKITGKFKAKTGKGKSMEKALAIIQFKLEEQTIKKFPEYEMESRLWLDRLSAMLKKGETAGLNDTYFPTIDLDDPTKLTEEEQEVIDDLTLQFTRNRKIKRLLNYFFKKGKTYHIHNNILNIHALIPSRADGEFEEFLGRWGKKLLDFIQETIERVGARYLREEPQEPQDQALFFYLWCGPKSPFFGKHAMKTFERYFLLDKESHTEQTLYWKKNLQTDSFKQKLKDEFGIKRVVFGHTPVDYLKGNQMASADGVAINVDGGFAAAYYNRGHALVHTPYQLFGIILPTPEEMQEAAKKLESAPLDIELIDEFRQPMKIKDTAQAVLLKRQSNALLRRIRELNCEPS